VRCDDLVVFPSLGAPRSRVLIFVDLCCSFARCVLRLPLCLSLLEGCSICPLSLFPPRLVCASFRHANGSFFFRVRLSSRSARCRATRVRRCCRCTCWGTCCSWALRRARLWRCRSWPFHRCDLAVLRHSPFHHHRHFNNDPAICCLCHSTIFTLPNNSCNLAASLAVPILNAVHGSYPPPGG
jgi:hypothetical protein